jgi:glycosyltransferase involved in cell wall biosynthesis
MHIGLNLLYASPAIGGAWRYINNVLDMIAKYDQHNSYSLFLYDQSPLPEAARAPQMQVHLLRRPRVGSRWLRVCHEQTEIPRLAKRTACALVHSFGNVAVMKQGIRNVVTVHDLKPYDRNEYAFPSARDLYLRAVLPRSLRKSEVVLPISQFTASAIQTRFRIEAKKMITVPNVVDQRFSPRPAAETARLRDRWQLPPEFWLYVANFYPHKNHQALLHAYDRYRRQTGTAAWPLVLCGAPALEYSRIRRLVAKLGLAAEVHFIHSLADDEMPALYSAAGAVVFASKYEGFGLPLLEAMACACPIAASDIPPLRELAGVSAITFHAESACSIADAMSCLQHDSARRTALAEAGLKAAERYREGVVVERLMDAYERGSKA